MIDDLFIAKAIDEAPEYVMCGDRTYRLRWTDFRGERRVVISWVDGPDVTGVIGGYFVDEHDALHAIDLAEARRGK